MQCPKCSVENLDNAKFCSECGFRLQDSSSQQSSFTGQKTVRPEKKAVVKVESEEDSFTGQKTSDKIVPLVREEEDIEIAEAASRYDFLEQIGEGGMGVVYKARDKRLGRIVAIKRLHIREQESRMGIERFLREARTIASLNHKNIVMVHDIGRDGLGHYIVMEYVDGIVLSVYIKKKGKLALEESLEIFQGIGSGLSYAHKKEIVHRDIKPGNIIIATDRVPKILDFGLARMGVYSPLSLSGYGMGTMDYASPEQKCDAKNVNHRSDIYSLGATLYEMLTGEIPRTVRSDRLPPEMVAIVLKCMEEKPERRYFSIDEILQDCDKATKQGSPQKIAPIEELQEGTCPKCSFVNKAEAKFCRKCGLALFEPCLACQKEIRVGSEYCELCGIHLPTHKKGLAHLQQGKEYLQKHQYSQAVEELEQASKILQEKEEAKNALSQAREKDKKSKELFFQAKKQRKHENTKRQQTCTRNT